MDITLQVEAMRTRLEAIVDFIGRSLVTPEPNNRERSLNHAYERPRLSREFLDDSMSYLPGWISVTRMGVSTNSRMRDPVNAFTACLVAVYMLPPG